ASAVYRREANQALYNNMLPEIQQQLQKIRIDSKGDPEVASKNFGAYIQSLGKAAPNAATAAAITQHGAHEASQHITSMMAQEDQLRLQQFHQGSLARIQTLDEETQDLAMQGLMD